MAIHGKRMVPEDQIKKLEDLDVSKLQPKLTAGENITIENNVISATGGSTLYNHNLVIKDKAIFSETSFDITYSFKIRSTKSTALTYSEITNILKDYTEYPCSITAIDATHKIVQFGSSLFIASYALQTIKGNVAYVDIAQSSTEATVLNLSTSTQTNRTIIDTITE